MHRFTHGEFREAMARIGFVGRPEVVDSIFAQMTEEEHEAVHNAALRDAVKSSERAYNETSSLDHAKVVIQLLLERLERH